MHEFGSFLVYTTREGGPMSVWWATREKYEEARHTGRLNTTPHRDEPTWVELTMVAFAPVEDLHGFAPQAQTL